MQKSSQKIYSTQQTIYFIGGVHKSGTNLVKDILNQLHQVSLAGAVDPNWTVSL